MKTNKLVRDYYVLAALGVDDDQECSKQHWLDQHLIQAVGEDTFELDLPKQCVVQGFRACVLRDRDRKEVIDWATESFGGRSDYYVLVVEHRWKTQYSVTPVLAYDSPNIRGRIKGPRGRLDMKEIVRDYATNMLGIIEHDRNAALLAKREKERGE